MEAFLSPSRPVNQFFGLYPGIVVDNVDPEKRYRVKVKFPWMMESEEKYVDVKDKEEMRSTWCRISSPMAGTNKHEGGETDELRGFFGLPEKDDEVVVAFMFGSFREPIIMGQMYNGKDLPFWQNKESKGVQIAEKNNLRGFRSRSGHMLGFVDKGKDDADKIVIQCKVKDENVYDQPALGCSKSVSRACGGSATDIDCPDGDIGSHALSMDMTPGKEHVLLTDKKGELLMKFDCTEQTVYLYSEKDIVINAKENISIKCKDLKLETDKTCEFKSGTTWKQESGTTMELTSGDTMTCKGGPNIELNP